MKSASRRLIHVGINHLISPPLTITNQTFMQFQQAVLTQGLEFQRTNRAENRIVLERVTPTPLQITVGINGPQLGQLLIVAPDTKAALSLFIQEAEAVIAAFESVWLPPTRQILRTDATMRELYETESQHAFQELWEVRLNQPMQSLAAFGRPIRGGGLRFVMDAQPGDDHPAQVEVKIESFLQDTSKVFVETLFNWLKPQVAFETRPNLEQMNQYVQSHVQQFMVGGQTAS
jgi:hypothetical protein